MNYMYMGNRWGEGYCWLLIEQCIVESIKTIILLSFLIWLFNNTSKWFQNGGSGEKELSAERCGRL